MDVTIVPMQTSSHSLLATTKGWLETPLPAGRAISKHRHTFQAIYYTFGVPTMWVGSVKKELPEAAMVVVPEGVIHGWLGPDQGEAVVGHYHEGHGDHELEVLQ